MFEQAPRIALIHALEESVLPIRDAFTRVWPEAALMHLLDASLSTDLAARGALDDDIVARFVMLGRYAAGATGIGGQTAAILFTCSAFGPAIQAVKDDLPLPILRPNEAAFEEALALGDRLALVVTFPPSLPALMAELHDLAAGQGRVIDVTPILVEGALTALKSGDGEAHDTAVLEACKGLQDQDAVILGQFSLARAADRLRARLPFPVLTTPDSAVAKLKREVGI